MDVLASKKRALDGDGGFKVPAQRAPISCIDEDEKPSSVENAGSGSSHGERGYASRRRYRGTGVDEKSQSHSGKRSFV